MRNLLVLILGIYLLANTTIASERKKLELGPVLSFPQPDSVYVWWHTQEPCGFHQVQYGLTKSLGKVRIMCKSTEYPHIRLANLQPGKRYFYRVGSGKTTSAIYHFKLPVASSSFRIGIWADNQEADILFSKYTIPTLLHYRPDMLLACGDLVFNGKDPYCWSKYLYKPAQKLLSTRPWFPVRGNHDGEGAVTDAMLPFPKKQKWYAYSYGPVRLVVLNSNVNYLPRSLQWKWLVKEVESTEWKSAIYRIVSVHEPPFTSIWDSVSHDGLAAMRVTIVPLLENAGADVVVCGHAHSYQRGHRQTPHGKTHYFIVGGGGGKLDTVQTYTWPHIGIIEIRHHIIIADVGSKELKIRAIDSKTCKIFDQLVIAGKAIE